MKVQHWYHIYCGYWTVPVMEHIKALKDSGLINELSRINIGIVGDNTSRSHVFDYLISEKVDFTVVAQEEEGWEQVTLNTINATEGAVLYCHTKGAAVKNEINEAWRRSMTKGVVYGWRNCVEKLEQGYDAVGCHYLDPSKRLLPVTVPFFGGNFWMANASYLQKLPRPVCPLSRHYAETHIGLGNPKVYDLKPGWPGFGNFL